MRRARTSGRPFPHRAHELTGLGERDERDLERRLLGGGEVPGREGALESCAGMALRGHEHTFPYSDGFAPRHPVLIAEA